MAKHPDERAVEIIFQTRPKSGETLRDVERRVEVELRRRYSTTMRVRGNHAIQRSLFEDDLVLTSHVYDTAMRGFMLKRLKDGRVIVYRSP